MKVVGLVLFLLSSSWGLAAASDAPAVPAQPLFSTGGGPGIVSSGIRRLLPTDPREETLHYDRAESLGIGLASGGTFTGAIRLIPTETCTLKAVVFYHWSSSSNQYLFVWGPGSSSQPGAVRESVPYTGSDSLDWRRVELTTPLVMNAGVAFWVGPRITHVAGKYPLGVDGGPMNANGGFLYDGATWTTLLAQGLSYNWNIRALVVVPEQIQRDVAANLILAPSATIPPGTVVPKVRIQNVGRSAESGFPVHCWIDSATTRIYDDTVTFTGTLPVGGTDSLAFPGWTPGPVGTNYRVGFATCLSGDQNPANDTIRGTTSVSNHDLAATEVLAPGSSISPGAVAPKVRIHNAGSNAESGFPVHCWIDSATTRIYDQSLTYSGSIAAGAYDSVTFPNWNAGPAGASYAVSFFTDLSTDRDRSNDTVRGTTTMASHDLSTTQIIAPGATVDPGSVAPRVRVRNVGQFTETGFQVRCWIDSTGTRVYNNAATYSGSLAPGDFDSLTFGTWSAGPMGNTYQVTFFTNLGSDVNRANDTIRGATTVTGHDLSATEVLAPSVGINAGPVAPRVLIRNSGQYTEAGFPVHCWIDSVGTRIYDQAATFAGSLPAGGTDSVAFPVWTPGPAGNRYRVTFFSDLGTDQDRANDTTRSTTTVSAALFSDTIVVSLITEDPPVIDGVIGADEWRRSKMYDVSDLRGRSGLPAPVGSNIAYFLYDDVFMYFGIDCPMYGSIANHDRFEPYFDEDRSGTWATDSSEGCFWMQHLGSDSATYHALLDLVPHVWVMGPAADAQNVMSTASGHVQVECCVPFGDRKSDLSIRPGDTVRYFQRMGIGGDTSFIGWWPQTLVGTQWMNPAWYGTMVFNPVVATEEAAGARGPCVLYRVASPVRGDLRVRYCVRDRGDSEVAVFDAAGKLVRRLSSGPGEPGARTVTWDRTDGSGARVGPGTYFIRLTAGGSTLTAKSVLLD